MQKINNNILYAIYENIKTNNNNTMELPLIVSEYLLDIINYLNGIIKIDSKHINKYYNGKQKFILNDSKYLTIHKIIED